jgi:hypothetical protein
MAMPVLITARFLKQINLVSLCSREIAPHKAGKHTKDHSS